MSSCGHCLGRSRAILISYVSRRAGTVNLDGSSRSLREDGCTGHRGLGLRGRNYEETRCHLCDQTTSTNLDLGRER